MGKTLDYDLYSEEFTDGLAEILQENRPDDQAEDAQALARECAQNKAHAIAKVEKFSTISNWTWTKS